MACEPKRGCGYRVVGGLYLVGSFGSVACDRLPIPVGSCPICGMGIHFTRALTRINPYRLWGNHSDCDEDFACVCCRPPTGQHFLMMVGEKFYSPDSFTEEAKRLGVSKRVPTTATKKIPTGPKGLKLGSTVVYLAHSHAVRLPDDPITQEPVFQMGVFSAFKPQRLEYLMWKSEATPERVAEYAKHGVTVIPILDGDPDHTPKKQVKATRATEEFEDIIEGDFNG